MSPSASMPSPHAADARKPPRGAVQATPARRDNPRPAWGAVDSGHKKNRPERRLNSCLVFGSAPRAPLWVWAAIAFEPSSSLPRSEGHAISDDAETVVVAIHESWCRRTMPFRPVLKRLAARLALRPSRRAMSIRPVLKLYDTINLRECCRRAMSIRPVLKPMRPVSAHDLAFRPWNRPKKTGFALQRPRASLRLTSLHAREFPRPPRYFQIF